MEFPEYLNKAQITAIQMLVEHATANNALEFIWDDKDVLARMLAAGITPEPTEKNRTSLVLYSFHLDGCAYSVAKHHGKEKPEDNGWCALKFSYPYVQKMLFEDGVMDWKLAVNFTYICLLILGCHPNDIKASKMDLRWAMPHKTN